MAIDIFIGIDPGKSGAIAWIYRDDRMPEWVLLKGTEADIVSDIRPLTLWEDQDTFCVLEHVHSMPKQGVASSFNFGASYGFLRGLLTAFEIPFEKCQPLKWQKYLGCQSKGNKNITKSKAQELFPQIAGKVTHQNADAILIAEYCRRVHR